MLDIKALQENTKRNQFRLEDNFLKFSSRLKVMEQELILPPYARISEVIEWAEKLKNFIGKINLIRESSFHYSRQSWIDLEKYMFGYFQVNQEYIFTISSYVVFLRNLEERYRVRMEVFGTYLDNGVRYLRGYVEDLVEQGINVRGILAEAESLSQMNWVRVLNYNQENPKEIGLG